MRRALGRRGREEPWRPPASSIRAARCRADGGGRGFEHALRGEQPGRGPATRPRLGRGVLHRARRRPPPSSSRRAVHSRTSPRTLSTARRRATRARDARADHRRRRRHARRFFLSTLLARVVAVVSLAPLSRATRLRTRARDRDAPRVRARALGDSTRARVDPSTRRRVRMRDASRACVGS